MTIAEAERQYDHEIKQLKEDYKNKMGNYICISATVGGILWLLAIIFFIMSSSSSDNVISICLAVPSLAGGSIILILIYHFSKKQEKGPENFLPQIKNLYLNYLQCEDLSADNKEFYKQKLEEIRHFELINAINNASLSVMSAILFTTLKK